MLNPIYPDVRRRFNRGARACAATILALILAATGLGQERETPRPEEPLGDKVVRLIVAGRYAEATPLAEELLSQVEKAGMDEAETAKACYVLASVYSNRGFYERALPLFERALGIFKKLGDSPLAAMVLNNMAMMYTEQADYKRAVPLLQQVVEIFEKEKGEAGKLTNAARNNLASAYFKQGEAAKAVPLLLHSLRVQEQALGKDHPDLAGTLNNLGVVFSGQDDDERALAYHERALKIREKLGLENPDLAQSLANVASKYIEDKEYARALPLLERALKIYEQSVGPQHPDVANVLDSLAEVHFFLHKDAGRAAAEFQRALEIRVAALGEKHPDTAGSLLSIAGMYLYQNERDYERVLPLIRRALNSYEETLGPDHPEVAGILMGLAEIYNAQGNHDDALKLLRRSGDIEEGFLTQILNIGSQQQKQHYLQTKLYRTNVRVVSHLLKTPETAEAARVALTAILRYKSRGLDAFANQVENLRRHATPETAQLLDRLKDLQAQLARLLLSGGGALAPEARRGKIESLNDEQERLEDAIGRRSAEFRVITQAVAFDSVRGTLPADAALVEMFFYVPYKMSKGEREYTSPRYVAYVLRPGDDAPRAVDLGDMRSLDEQVARFRDLLQRPGSNAARLSALARGLDERLMRPVRKLLGTTRRIFLAPDGDLNLIPFGALLDENGQYLIENYSLNYLTSGRDLLRLRSAAEGAEGAAAIVANPQFDLERPSVTCKSAGRGLEPAPGAPDAQVQYREMDFKSLCYPTLKGTAQEAAQIRPLLPGSLLLTGQGATEAALKGLRRPRVLHIATHGFFLFDQPLEMLGGRELVLQPPAQTERAPRNDSPLLRSGLVLAGVKQGRSGPGEGNDGVLTALEAAGLDLFGTKLVVLSACETGLGDVTSGEGVYGLRRALVLAGSETQVMSLWKVSDRVTRDLMVAYYERLRAGEGRSEALRAVQLSMLKSGGKAGGPVDVSHPFYWAAFIQSGAWSPLDGDEQPPRRRP
jgi:CHAT domain-containing protein/tetratricopeptide (TPR) repeat protein